MASDPAMSAVSDHWTDSLRRTPPGPHSDVRTGSKLAVLGTVSQVRPESDIGPPRRGGRSVWPDDSRRSLGTLICLLGHGRVQASAGPRSLHVVGS